MTYSRSLLILLALAVTPAQAEPPIVAGPPAAATTPAPATDSLDLTDRQVQQITLGQVAAHDFPVQQSAVGSIDFDEDTEAQVFPPYQGKILQLFVRGGDPVQKTQILYTIDSPDLVQAESTLISDRRHAAPDQPCAGPREGPVSPQRHGAEGL